MTTINKGDLVWIDHCFSKSSSTQPTKGEVVSKIDDNWFRIYSSYQTDTGLKTNIQDFPSQMLRKIC